MARDHAVAEAPVVVRPGRYARRDSQLLRTQSHACFGTLTPAIDLEQELADGVSCHRYTGGLSDGNAIGDDDLAFELAAIDFDVLGFDCRGIGRREHRTVDRAWI